MSEIEKLVKRALFDCRKTYLIEERGQRYRALTAAESALIGDFIDHAADDLAEEAAAALRSAEARIRELGEAREWAEAEADRWANRAQAAEAQVARAREVLEEISEEAEYAVSWLALSRGGEGQKTSQGACQSPDERPSDSAI